MQKKIRTVMSILISLLLIVVFSIILTYNSFKVYNPLVVLNALSQVKLTEKEYIQIQNYPKVIVADSNILLKDYMQELGYTETETGDQLGGHDDGLREFQVAEHLEYISQTDYKYFSVWIWR